MAFREAFSLGQYDPAVDVDSDGAIGGLEFAFFRSRIGGAPGPSGLACAGQIPCGRADPEAPALVSLPDTNADCAGAAPCEARVLAIADYGGALSHAGLDVDPYHDYFPIAAGDSCWTDAECLASFDVIAVGSNPNGIIRT